MSIFSVSFLGFVAVLTGLYFFVPKRYQWLVLLAASTLFYLSGGWQGIFYILVTIISQYILALALERRNGEMNRRLLEEGLDGRQKKQIKREYASKKKCYVVLSVLINIGILVFVKCANLAVENVNRIFALRLEPFSIFVPLGLSYYTFKSVGYVIDVYRDRVRAEHNILKLALYISYFPALIQGPIDRYEDLACQLTAEHRFDYQRLTFGAQRMLWGYIKKLVIADRIAVVVNTVIGSYATAGYEGFIVFGALFLGCFRIYADFSGGMDIVNGLSEIFGISLTENFQRPFFATSLAEYWQRWHITLGAWLKTYVFYPLTLSPAFNRLSKKCRKLFGDQYGKLVAPSLASFITFFLIGMWHGVGSNYLVYSIYQAVLVSSATLFSDVYCRMRKFFRVDEASKTWHVFQIVRTLLVVTIARYFTMAANISEIWNLFKATFASFNIWVFFDGSFYTLGLDQKNFTLMLFSIAGLLIVDYIQEKGIRIRESIARQNIVLRWCIYYGAIFALLIFGMYGPGYDAASFIYQRF